jgi:hypothetical protein
MQFAPSSAGSNGSATRRLRILGFLADRGAAGSVLWPRGTSNGGGGGDVLVPPFSTGSHIGITCATGLSVTVATGAGDGEGPHADLGGKPSSQVAARTLETGRCAWSCPAVVPCGDRRTTSTTRLPVAPPLRGMLRSSRCSVGPDWPPPRSANTWSISDMGLQEAFEGLIGFAAGDLLVWRSCDRLAVPFLNLGCDLRSRKQSDQVDKA